MSTELPVGTILWAKNRPSDHNNHLHVEPPPPRKTGVPPLKNPGMSPGVRVIYDALVVEFGTGYYFTDPEPPTALHWSHMGGWNRRKIAGTQTWSQHAWWNALDIGPYYGVAEQQRFYDFLTGLPTIPLPGEDTMLPLTPTSAREDIRSLQGRLNTAHRAGLTEDGIYGESTVAAVRTHLGHLTGDPNAQQGLYVVARQWNGLLETFIKTTAGNGGTHSHKVQGTAI